MKYIDTLHYITQEVPGKPHLALIEQACKAGITWIQLRMKHHTFEECFSTALQAKSICHAFKVTLIINDHVDIAKRVGADGVHLGKDDMEPTKARAILGQEAIIGGTANTFEDVVRLHHAGVDYIGVGPYRFTSTKEKLSPVLGLDGYSAIVADCQRAGITLPLVAVGGIKMDDVNVLKNAGVYGVAVASGIALQPDMRKAIAAFKDLLPPTSCPLPSPDEQRVFF